MTILYSILDHPRALQELNDAGVLTSKIQSLLDDYPHRVRQSPANFAFVSSASRQAGAAQALPVAPKTNAARSRRLKNIYGFIARKMNASTAATGARGKLALDEATMVTMNRKMRLVEPDMSDTELQALLAALMTVLLPVDLMTACVALNPGGPDAVVLVAASIRVDLPLILAMQVTRLMVVMALGPTLGRWAARQHLAAQAGSQ